MITMKRLGKATVSKYLADGGGFCPFCKSTNVDGHGFDFDSAVLPTEMGSVEQHCYNCGKSWRDYYKLHRIQEVG